jgi:hypothetical protein
VILKHSTSTLCHVKSKSEGPVQKIEEEFNYREVQSIYAGEEDPVPHRRSNRDIGRGSTHKDAREGCTTILDFGDGGTFHQPPVDLAVGNELTPF